MRKLAVGIIMGSVFLVGCHGKLTVPHVSVGVGTTISSNETASTTRWASSATARQQGHIAYFKYDSSELTATGQRMLRQEARYLMAHPKAKARLSGHTDERGSREYNIALGWRRAQAAARFLTAQGVGRKQLDLMSYGREKPLALTHNERAWAQNRRVEVQAQIATTG
jgi:peptidoglycan-associated lipoprotein